MCTQTAIRRNSVVLKEFRRGVLTGYMPGSRAIQLSKAENACQVMLKNKMNFLGAISPVVTIFLLHNETLTYMNDDFTLRFIIAINLSGR